MIGPWKIGRFHPIIPQGTVDSGALPARQRFLEPQPGIPFKPIHLPPNPLFSKKLGHDPCSAVIGRYDELLSMPMDTVEGLSDLISIWSDLVSHLQSTSLEYQLAFLKDGSAANKKESEEYHREIMVLVGDYDQRVLQQAMACVKKLSVDENSPLGKLVGKMSHLVGETQESLVAINEHHLLLQSKVLVKGTSVTLDGVLSRIASGEIKLAEMDEAFFHRINEVVTSITTLFAKIVNQRRKSVAPLSASHYPESIARTRGRDSLLPRMAFFRRLIDSIESSSEKGTITAEKAIALSRKGSAESVSFGQGSVIDTVQKFFSSILPEFRFFEGKIEMDLEERDGKAQITSFFFNDASKEATILMTMRPTLKGALGLVHEMGHAVHALYASEQKTYWEREPDACVTEMVAKFFELVFSDTVDVHFPSELHQALSRYVYYLEFQYKLYDMESVTPEGIRKAWIDSYREYLSSLGYELPNLNAQEEDVVALIMAARPHFFSHPFYEEDYLLAQLAAIVLHQSYRKDSEGFMAKFIKMLQAGSSLSVPEIFSELSIDSLLEESLASFFNSISLAKKPT